MMVVNNIAYIRRALRRNLCDEGPANLRRETWGRTDFSRALREVLKRAARGDAVAIVVCHGIANALFSASSSYRFALNAERYEDAQWPTDWVFAVTQSEMGRIADVVRIWAVMNGMAIRDGGLHDFLRFLGVMPCEPDSDVMRRRRERRGYYYDLAFIYEAVAHMFRAAAKKGEKKVV